MHTQLLPYNHNSAELFDHFAHLPYAVFFDSCRSAQAQGRYDIIAADPCDIITEATATPIFETIKQKLQTLKLSTPHTHASTLPFTIGAMGYLSYDIGRQLEAMPEHAIDDIALPQAVVGIYDWSIVVDHQEQKTYFTSLDAFDSLKIKNILALLKRKDELPRDAHSVPMEAEAQAPAKFSITKNFTSNMTRDYYNNAFNTIKKHILAGNCYQVNLAQRFSAEFTGSPWHAYQSLRTKNPAPYAAFMQFNNAAILSLSPERFLKVCGDNTEAPPLDRAQINTTFTVETKPIKGTAPRFSNQHQDQQSAQNLLNSEKDRAENIMIVDLLRNDLSRTCVAGSVQTPTLCALESFSNVHHLVSTITGTLSENKTAIDLLAQCFPGGSITGAPKIEAMKIIESLEPHRRSVYCGSLFYADMNGNCDSNIAIRTVICDDNKMHVYAGGGIVYDSECDSEYAETLTKVQKIMAIIAS